MHAPAEITTPMSSVEAELLAYLKRSKFGNPDAWLGRGLNPSPPHVTARMELLVNEVCTAALAAVREGRSAKQLEALVVGALRRHKAGSFDTEDREFIADEVNSLAQIVGVRVAPALNSWLYGPVLGWLINRKNSKNER
jgi:hypothetical protein